MRNPSRMPYATFARRLNALLLDAVLGVVVILGVVLAAAPLQEVLVARVVLFALMWGWVLLYEPLCIWRGGATLGHRAFNVDVVDAGTGARLGVGRAFLRYGIKALLGVVSLFTIAFTRRGQALHDLLTGSVVRVHDLARARPSHYWWAPPS